MAHRPPAASPQEQAQNNQRYHNAHACALPAGETPDWHELFEHWGAAVDWPACSFYKELMQVPGAAGWAWLAGPAGWLAGWLAQLAGWLAGAGLGRWLGPAWAWARPGR